MLDAIRRGVGSWFVKAFLGLLVLSFAVWGIGDIFRIQPDTAVAEVGEREVGQQELLRAYEREVQRLQSQLGGLQIGPDSPLRQGLSQQALQSLINRALYDNEADRLDLSATDIQAAEMIRENPAFRNELNQFDRFRFEQLIAQNGFNEAMFVASTKRDLVREQLSGAIGAGAFVPRTLARTVYAWRNEKRTLESVLIPNTVMREVAEPDEAALAAWHRDNEDDFKAPEYRAITWVAFTATDLADQVRVDEDAVRDLYTARLDILTTPANRTVEQILADSREAAAAAAGRLQGGSSLEDAAGPDDIASSLGKVTAENLPASARDAVFDLPVGGISAPVETPLGWHVFRVTAREDAIVTAYEDARADLEKELRLERAGEALYQLSNDVDEDLAGGATLEEVAQKFDLPHGRASAIDAEGKGRSGEPVANLPSLPEFLSVAFDIAEGDEPELRESESGGYMLIRVDGITEPALRPLEEVREAVREAVLRDRRMAAADEAAQALAQSWAGGGDAQAEAGNRNWVHVPATPLTRADATSQANLSPELVNRLFAASPGEVIAGRTASDDGAAVVRLVAVTPADPAADAEQVSQLEDSLTAGVVNDLFAQYTGAMRATYAVQINQRVLDTLFTQ